ncbi:putative L-amino-acid oxidase YobN [Cladorrhinum sp. PSN259]|nr:putative L-amino-acid oxidase YobN [Cladorrhinum sp. PSN259]
MDKKQLNVGIVGGGIAGLYTALCLQREGHRVHIFEGTDRIGGRVHTHYFTPDRDQYYEAGAMRIPEVSFQDIFFELVRHVNERVPAERRIELIKYVQSAPGNLVYINGLRPQFTAMDTTPAEVSWPNIDPPLNGKSAKDLLNGALSPLVAMLTPDFEAGFWKIVEQYDNYTFRYYCIDVVGWTSSLVDFVETMTSQTNQFNLSVPELVMQSLDFGAESWKTINGGMSRLPEAMAQLVGLNNITFGARVTGIKTLLRRGQGREEKLVAAIIATGYNGTIEAIFDQVVLAIPPAALRMIVDRPRWSPAKEMAIRALHFEPLYKMGLRFKTRFWEQVQSPSMGGQSTTDLPIRWIVYPSNGIPPPGQNDDGSGVLLVYSWMTDATNWLPLTPLERRNVVINCLAQVYNREKDGNGNPIDVHSLFIQSADHVWASSTATGDAMFLPGQFKQHFEVACSPEGPIYFAGEHLSLHHTWIAGAADSALRVVRDMLHKPNLPPLDADYKPPPDGPAPTPPGHCVHAPFNFRPYNPMFCGSPGPGAPPGHLSLEISHRWSSQDYQANPTESASTISPRPTYRGSQIEDAPVDSDSEIHESGRDLKGKVKAPPPKLPTYLGTSMPGMNPLGVVSTEMASSFATASWNMGRIRLG